MATRIIAIESSDRAASVAALEARDDQLHVVGSQEVISQQRPAQALLPELQSLLGQCRWRPGDVQLVCVAAGPGSFTGLRIGVTAAKTLAYAVGAELAGVSTLAAIAAQIAARVRPMWAVLSAQRDQLYCARFSSTAEAIERCQPADASASILTVDAWLGQLAPGQVVAGPPLERIADRLPKGVESAPQEVWRPKAVTVGQLGYSLMTSGRTIDPMQLTPYYIRRSAAEEKAQKKAEEKADQAAS